MHKAEEGLRIFYTCNRCKAEKEYFVDAPSGDDFDEETHRPDGWELMSDEGEGEHLCLKCIKGDSDMPIDIKAIEARCEGLPDRPWIWIESKVSDIEIRRYLIPRKLLADAEDIDYENFDHQWFTANSLIHDAWTPQIDDFIAHARTDIPALLNEVRRLQKQLEAEYGRGVADGETMRALVEVQASARFLATVPHDMQEAHREIANLAEDKRVLKAENAELRAALPSLALTRPERGEG